MLVTQTTDIAPDISGVSKSRVKTEAVTLKVRQKGECSFESSVKFEIIHQIVHHERIEIWNVTENEFLLTLNPPASHVGKKNC